MTATECSRFDELPIPVLLIGEDLRVIYFNDDARRCYPMLLPTENLSSFYSKRSVGAIRASFAAGNACLCRLDRQISGTMLFEPVFAADGAAYLQPKPSNPPSFRRGQISAGAGSRRRRGNGAQHAGNGTGAAAADVDVRRQRGRAVRRRIFRAGRLL